MVDYVTLKYAMLLSNRFPMWKVKATNPYRINFRCHICGDSQKSKFKARGWLLERDNEFGYYCHNCGSSQPFSSFLKGIDATLYNEYVTEKFIDKSKKPEKKSTIEEEKFEQPKFDTSALKKIKKVSSLKADHPVKQYLEKRQIPPNQHYRIFYAPKFKTWINSIIPNKFPPFKRDEPRLILPFLDESGKLFGLSARGFDPNGLRYITIMFDETKAKVFGLDKVDFTKRYYIVEGAIDSLFIDNAVAMAGADGNTNGLQQVKNGVFVFDDEPRNREVHMRMEKVIRNGHKICIWPDNMPAKDINEMILAGMSVEEIHKIINENTYTGLEASLKLAAWRKV